jgi:hypothetical protein
MSTSKIDIYLLLSNQSKNCNLKQTRVMNELNNAQRINFGVDLKIIN